MDGGAAVLQPLQSPARTTRPIDDGTRWMLEPAIELPIAYFKDYADEFAELTTIKVDIATVDQRQLRGSSTTSFSIVFQNSTTPEGFRVVASFTQTWDEVFPDYMHLDLMHGIWHRTMRTDTDHYDTSQIRLLGVVHEILAYVP